MYGPKFLDLLGRFDLLYRERVPIPGQMATGATVIRDSVISVILGGLGATSRK